MNIAIIIGVSNYSDSKNNLPGCKNDAEAIYQIIKRKDKFDSILYVNDNETSAKTKERLTNFILENKSKQVTELFFYYSGHGEFSNDEFYYILSDFDTKKKNQTSLQNSEIDDLVRTLSPELVIKVIDACQSGTTYIKESNILNKYFNDSKKGFNKCYFLNSSLNNQSSFQDKNISFFTFSFINALKEHNTNEIRYKDIIDVISDEFSNNQEQTPFFIIQADLTEKFCSFSRELKEYLSSFNTPQLSTTALKNKPLSISELVKQDAKEYINKEGAIKSIKFIQQEFKTVKLDSEIAELYNLEINFLDDYRTIPQTKVIGTWLKKNKNDFFAKLVFEDAYDDDTGEEYSRMVGFDLKFETPFKAISIEINSLFPNLVSYQCNIVFLISKKLLRFFYFVTNYIDESWDSKYLNASGIQWMTSELKIADESAISNAVLSIKGSIDVRIKKDLEDRFKIQNETTEGESDDLPF
jgi:hypothetical protein